MSVWDDLVGQCAASAVLATAARDAATGGPAMTHAWLVTGPPGSGRSNAATAFAAALQCPNGGCGTCRDCRLVLAGSHSDVTQVATQKVTMAIDEVRALVSLAYRPPVGSAWRVIVLQDADRMTERTANVLLKAIEEPPPSTVWVLCAPSREDVIVTIRSRCRWVGLRVPPLADVVDLLVRRDGVDPKIAELSARAAGCHIGLARRLALDPEARARRGEILGIPLAARSVGEAVIAAGELVELAQAEATEVTEESDAAGRAALLRSLGAEEVTGALPPAVRAQIRQYDEDCKRRATRAQRDVLDRILTDLMSLYRDVLVTLYASEVGVMNVASRREVSELAERLDPAGAVACLDAISLARRRLAGNVAPALALESMLLTLTA